MKPVSNAQNDAEAKVIAEKGYEFIFRNLRYEDVKRYWRELLNEYAKLLKFDVRKHPETQEVGLFLFFCDFQ